MNIVSCDWSLTSPSFTILQGGCEWENATVHYLTSAISRVGKYAKGKIIGTMYPRWDTPMERYIDLASWCMMAIACTKFDEKPKIFLEDYSMGSKGKVFHIAEGTAILKYLIYQNQFELVTVPPTVLKKHATGNGHATKEMMGRRFQELTGINLAKILGYEGSYPYEFSPASDIQDSFLLARYGWDQCNAQS